MQAFMMQRASSYESFWLDNNGVPMFYAAACPLPAERQLDSRGLSREDCLRFRLRPWAQAVFNPREQDMALLQISSLSLGAELEHARL